MILGKPSEPGWVSLHRRSKVVSTLRVPFLKWPSQLGLTIFLIVPIGKRGVRGGNPMILGKSSEPGWVSLHRRSKVVGTLRVPFLKGPSQLGLTIFLIVPIGKRRVRGGNPMILGKPSEPGWVSLHRGSKVVSTLRVPFLKWPSQLGLTIFLIVPIGKRGWVVL